MGAGLPILNTLRELVLTGDKIISIEGILSGTLAYIFNAYNLQKSFSDVVKEAKSLGYTEPDPRDDLSGTDVARKVVILAREAGRSLDLKDIAVENLVPANLLKCPTDEFMQRLSELDTPMNNKLLEANKNNQVLRYVGALSETGQATVGLKSYPKEHPFARIQGSDNIVAFTTQRYSKQPLIIQGPGAGPEVTAAGVFADLLRLASFLGAS